jgi:hypothetical protein
MRDRTLEIIKVSVLKEPHRQGAATSVVEMYSSWFFMTPSIATKFQYINFLLISFFAHYMFRPLRAIQLVTISVFEGLFQYNGSVARTQFDYKDVICRHLFFNLQS